MLVHLAVSNLGVLDSASIDPAPGLTAITGETGTGKTLLLGGIRQLLGEPGKSELVGPLRDEAAIDALFVVDDQEIGATRVVPKDGRSRTRIDGAIVSAETAREALSPLIEIVAQHDQMSLRRVDHLRRIVDDNLDEVGRRALDDHQSAWQRYREALDREAALGGDLTTLARELDLARHQAQEIEAANLAPDLDSQLERDLSRLRNITEIQENLAATIDLNTQVTELVGEIVARLRKVAEYDEGLSILRDSAESLVADAQELSTQTRVAMDSQDADPDALTTLEMRLTSIGDLKRKYGRTLADVIAFGEAITQRAATLESLLSEAESIEARVEADKAAVVVSAAELTKSRRRVCDTIEEGMMSHLSDLGMATAVVSLELQPVEPSVVGGDRLELLFAADSRLTPSPVGDVASGGELSRLVLAFRLAAAAEATATLVFDEVDAGIGGETALAMGEKLAGIAINSQVLCVTHLPQVAARADRHYVVTKDADGVASTKLVVSEERIEALAKMMSGADTDSGRAAARELLGDRLK